MGMGLRLLSGFVSARTSERYRRDLRTSPRRFRARMGSVLTEPDGGRFSGVARRTGMDCREISPLRSRRAYAAGLEAVARCGGLMKLPQGWERPFEWQAAMEALILVATLGGPTLFARIGIMRALNRHVKRVFDSDRKDTQWG